MELLETGRDERKERVILVGVQFPRDTLWEVEDHLEELRLLAESARAEVAGRIIVKRGSPKPAYYIGKGKVDELKEQMEREEIETAIFDDDLTPAQQRNLEERIELKMIDRTELILDIFAQRAKTREAQIQIELAQLKYLLPRLTRMWTHLSQQYGGIGTKGPGETQLEVDRRRLRERIHTLGREIKDVRRSRETQRKSRKRGNFHTAALVGYTNAGKSTLLNALSDTDIDVSSKLFSTLDPTTKRVDLHGNRKLLISDTVGFIRKLPHHLVESFMATFEEVVESDVLIHILDVSDPLVEERAQAVYNVLEEIGFHDKPIVTALNKIDRLSGTFVIERYEKNHPRCVAISALKRIGFDDLLHEIQSVFEHELAKYTLCIPQKDSRSISVLFREGEILRKAYHDNHVLLEARLDGRLASRFERYFHSMNDEESMLLFGGPR